MNEWTKFTIVPEKWLDDVVLLGNLFKSIGLVPWDLRDGSAIRFRSKMAELFQRLLSFFVAANI